MTKDEARQFADAIVADLFENGRGQQAQRLVLTVDTPEPRNLGGWGREPAADRIAAILRGEAPR